MKLKDLSLFKFVKHKSFKYWNAKDKYVFLMSNKDPILILNTPIFIQKCLFSTWNDIAFTVFIIIPPLPEGGGGYTVLPPSVCPSFQDIFRRIFLSNCWWQKSDIWSQASYRYTILWVACLDPSDSYFLFADLVGLYTHWTYMHIFRHIFLSN